MISDKWSDEIKRAQFDFSGKYKYIAIFTNPAFFVRKHLYEAINSVASDLKGSILDFGCGAKPYKNLFVNCSKYVGLDIESSGHDHSGESIDVYYDGKHIPFADEQFDNIFSAEVFEHVDNLDEIMSELNRVLKPEGLFLVTAPFVWKEHEIPYDFRRYTHYGLTRVLKKHGFQIIKRIRSTSYIEILFQLFISYIRESFMKVTSDRRIIILFQRIVITPIIITGIVASLILPRSYSLYADNVFLCKKISRK